MDTLKGFVPFFKKIFHAVCVSLRHIFVKFGENRLLRLHDVICSIST